MWNYSCSEPWEASTAPKEANMPHSEVVHEQKDNEDDIRISLQQNIRHINSHKNAT
jgi:hypothetical protein